VVVVDRIQGYSERECGDQTTRRAKAPARTAEEHREQEPCERHDGDDPGKRARLAFDLLGELAILLRDGTTGWDDRLHISDQKVDTGGVDRRAAT